MECMSEGERWRLRNPGKVVRSIASRALSVVEGAMDCFPDDTLEEARIKSRIWTLDVETPCETEDELGQLYLW